MADWACGVSSPLPLSGLQVTQAQARLTVAGEEDHHPVGGERRGMEQVAGLRDRQQPPLGDRLRLLLLPQPPTAEGPEQGEGAPQLTLRGVAPSPPSMDRTMPSPLTTASPPPWWAPTGARRAGRPAPPWHPPGATAPTQKRHRRGGWRWQAGAISTTGIFPYGRYALTPRLAIWATAGYGWGHLSLTPTVSRGTMSPTPPW